MSDNEFAIYISNTLKELVIDVFEITKTELETEKEKWSDTDIKFGIELAEHVINKEMECVENYKGISYKILKELKEKEKQNE